MNGQLFSIGQAVTPIEGNGSWIRLTDKTPSTISPQFGKIYHVNNYWLYQSEWYVMFKEIPGGETNEWFKQDHFAPVVSDTVLAEELSEIFSLEVRK